MRRLTIISIILGTLFSAVSCSVKEDRDLCPCWLQIDLSGCIHFGPEVQIKGWSGNKNVMGAKVFEEDFDTIYEAEVPRGSVSYCAYSGLERSRQSGMEIIIPEGEQSDRIYAYRTEVITLGETAYDKVHLHKQYANVFMSFAATEGMRIPGISVEIRSHWNGINLKDLSPLAGKFIFSPQMSKDGIWSFRLPRQGDDEMIMNVYSNGTLVDMINLGETISKTGYDWSAEDLDDIWIGVDWALGEITIHLDGWEEGQIYTETI